MIHFDQSFLKTVLRYEEDTGNFYWLERADARPQWNARYAGKLAGCERFAPGMRYWCIRINNYHFAAHRLAWLYMTGAWPTGEVDHRDMDGLNNRWANLREATKSQNGANTKLRRNNTTGFKGVIFLRRERKYHAAIFLNGRRKSLGYYDTAEAASEAYKAAALAKYGEFARMA